MWVVVEQYGQYEEDGIKAIHGPFPTGEEADEFCDKLEHAFAWRLQPPQ